MLFEVKKSVLATALCVLALSSVSPASGGRNGPQLSGDAIPVSVDRAITLDDLQKVTDRCMLDLGSRLFEQVKRASSKDVDLRAFNSAPPQLPSFTLLPNGTKKYEDGTQVAISYNVTTFAKGGSAYDQTPQGFFSVYVSNHFIPTVPSANPSINDNTEIYPVPELAISYNVSKPESQIYIVSLLDSGMDTAKSHYIPLPEFYYSGKVRQTPYDEMGNQADPKVIIQNLTILKPAEMRQKTVFHIANRVTKRVTSATLDYGAYLNCLTKRIQSNQ